MLQIATKVITNCDRLAYYKLRQNPITNYDGWLITNCDSYYKLRRLLQIAIEHSTFKAQPVTSKV